MESSLSVADPLLVAILGPTASGKTALSLALARSLQGEIVNCDSIAMYREFEIGTAKPTPKERARVPPHGAIAAGALANISAIITEHGVRRPPYRFA